jgi:hypothetical protein
MMINYLCTGVGLMAWSPLTMGLVSGKLEDGVPLFARSSFKVCPTWSNFLIIMPPCSYIFARVYIYIYLPTSHFLYLSLTYFLLPAFRSGHLSLIFLSFALAMVSYFSLLNTSPLILILFSFIILTEV